MNTINIRFEEPHLIIEIEKNALVVVEVRIRDIALPRLLEGAGTGLTLLREQMGHLLPEHVESLQFMDMLLQKVELAIDGHPQVWEQPGSPIPFGLS